MPGGRKKRGNNCRKTGNNHTWKDRFSGAKTVGFKRKERSASRCMEGSEGNYKRLKISDRLKESDVGITKFIGEDGFFGIIKERYTDFHVNEIGLDGRIAKLTSQDTTVSDRSDVQEDDLEELKRMVPESIWEQLQKLTETDVALLEIDVTDLSKNQRRAVHSIAKSLANVISQTVEKENRKIVVIRRSRDQTDGDKDRRIDWKKLGGTYCWFILHKVNMDTMDALNQLATSLKIKPNNLAYAGTKDRRGCTSQWVSLRRGNPVKLLRAAKTVRGAFVGNFEYSEKPLKLGMLYGNRFKIALRNVTATDEQIESTMMSLKENGFINYYGLQRFGTIAAIPTYDVGKALLQGKWNEAIELILKPREGEQDRDLAEARKIYEKTKDAFAAYENIKRSDKIEATLLRGIQAAGEKNPQGALDSLPRNIRLMYIHAYQSYVWNHMVSKRIDQFGKKPIVGDLVYTCNADCVDTVDDNQQDEAELGIEKKDVVIGDDATIGDETINEIDNDTPSLPSVMTLKEEDLEKYTLGDVLMPQVGWKVQYPSYAKSWFDEFLAKDGLTTDLRQKNKKYSLGGAYRKIMAIPTDLHWKIIRYKEKHSDLLRSDINELRDMPEPTDEPGGEYRGLIVEMTLKSSTYATMALREIIKCDTSPEVQANLSDNLNNSTGQSLTGTVEDSDTKMNT